MKNVTQISVSKFFLKSSTVINNNQLTFII